jgi:acyl-CoA reductase-like NAD-dependent aldehyde dehydrogenase
MSPEEAPMEERAAVLARVSADHGTEIKDPATGEVIGRVAFGPPGDVAADAIDAHAEELAYVVSREQGKTMNGLGARYEAAGCAAWVRATASTPLPVEVPGAWFSPRGTGRSRPRRTSCSGW